MGTKIASKLNWLGLLIICAAMTGCNSGESIDPAVRALREKYLLTSEPAGAVSLADARKAEADSEVVLVGKIGAVDAEPFSKGQASFVLSELPPEGHEHAGHDADNCPFCKRRASLAPLSYVQILGEDGKVLPIDAQKLLGVDKNQTVVVRGRGEVNGLGMHMVNADGIYLRK